MPPSHAEAVTAARSSSGDGNGLTRDVVPCDAVDINAEACDARGWSGRFTVKAEAEARPRRRERVTTGVPHCRRPGRVRIVAPGVARRAICPRSVLKLP